MKQFKKVAVLMGGPSTEREISLRSGNAVADGLRNAGYDVIEINIKDREFDVPDGVEAAFIALHGEFGEDGEIQQILDKKGIPYTGSGSEASRIAFDKKLSKEIFIQKGIPTPEYEILNRGEKRNFALPVVIKPLCQGSSIGIHRVLSECDWGQASEDTLSYEGSMIVEEYIKGRELTVGIIEDEALPVVEVVAPDEWYDYNAKYTKGTSRYLVPAPLDEEIKDACDKHGLDVFRALGCSGFARVDFRLSDNGKLYVLELNSIPGFTETSLLPMAAGEAGLDFSALCDRIMQTARLE
ncbi:D-alanine--D-alanine ligase [Verrucomicrobiota bacterium]